MRPVALGDHISRTLLALATLRGNTQLKLDIVKTHAGMDMAGNFSVRDALADTNNHGLGLEEVVG